MKKIIFNPKISKAEQLYLKKLQDRSFMPFREILSRANQQAKTQIQREG